MTDQTVINWNAIGRAFCEGKLTNTAIAKAHGITEGAIRRQAKKNGWKKGEPFPEKVLPFASKPAPPEIDPEASLASRLEDLATRMLDELHASTLAVGELEDLIYAETAGDRDGRRRAAMLQAISLPTRAATLSRLTKALAEAKAAAKAEPEGKKAKQAKAAGALTKPGGRFAPGAAPALALVPA